MIRKMPVFTDPRIDFQNKGFRPARKLARDIVEFAQDISMCSDQSHVDRFIADIFKGSKIVLEADTCRDFFRASKLAYRVETSIRQLPPDPELYITNPLFVHVSFFEKGQKQLFFEIKLKMFDDWSGRCYQCGFVGHDQFTEV